MKSVDNLRIETDFLSDPIGLFAHWQSQASGGGPITRLIRRIVFGVLGIEYPIADAAALATASDRGVPSARMVLVKEASDAGFVFYTNFTSRKAAELDANPVASLVFYWPMPPRQVRAEGKIRRLDNLESQAYWSTRSRGSQISALASKQSASLSDRADLVATVQEIKQNLPEGPIPCPDFWGGYRLIPHRIEFWQGRANRLHERTCYTRQDEFSEWEISMLQP